MEEFCTVNTNYGQVRGSKVISDTNVPYYRFMGIPYAKPMLGKLRFEAPQRPEPWDGVLDVLEEPSPSTGKNNYIKKMVGSDDCLYMNIYTKDVNPAKPYAVMLYIHGGGFVSGSSTLYSYSPDYILMNDVILVIFNYRLGALGYLRLNDPSLNVPGNAGMKDQQMAMRFVQENIHHFGGDPNNVTLIGHSSGGSCVGLHCTMESSKGLFHKAIMMSGSPLGTECLIQQTNVASQLAVKLNFAGNAEDESEVLEFLQQVDAIKLAEALDEMRKDKPFIGPCIESYQTDSTFMIAPPIEAMKNAWGNDIDILIGGTEDEGMYGKSDTVDFLKFIPADLQLSEDEKNVIARRLANYYLSLGFKDSNKAYEKYAGDAFRWNCMLRQVEARRLSGRGGKTYLYKFAVDSPTQNCYRNRYLGKGSRGVMHADELAYFWKSGLLTIPPKESREYKAVIKFTSLLTSFAITGDPNSNLMKGDLQNVKWRPVHSKLQEGLVIGDNVEFKVLQESINYNRVWKNLYKDYGTGFI